MPRRPSLLSYGRTIYTPFLDPVFLKDLESLSRRWRLYVGRMVYVGLVGAILLFSFRSLDGGSSPSEYANLGRSLFAGLVTFQMAYVTIAMAHLAADLLLCEAHSGTLLLMLLTPLSGWRIASGKWKATMAHAATLILAGLPPLGITAYLGGVGPWELLWSSSLSFALAGISSALSLYCALSSRTAVRATVAATSTIVLTGLLLFLICAIGFALTRSPWIPLVGSLLHPLIAAGGAAFAVSIGGLSAYGWIGASCLSLVFSQVLLMSAAGHLSISKTLDELIAPRGLAPSEFAPGLPSLEQRTVWQRHPLLWRELALQTVSRLGWTRRTTVAVFVLPILLLASDLLTTRQPNLEGWLVVLTGLSMGAGAGLFIRDKESRHLEVLLTLPVSSGDLVGAKLLSGVWNIKGAAFLIWTVLFVEFWSAGQSSSGWALSILILVFVLFSYVLSALASLRVRSQRAAFLCAASVIWGGLLGLPRLREAFPERAFAAAHPTLLVGRLLEGDGGAVQAILIFVAGYMIITAMMIGAIIFGYRRQIR